MYVLNFNQNFVKLDGEIIETPLCETLASSLAQECGEIRPRVAVGWAKALQKGEALHFQDDESFDNLYKYIENHKQFTPLYKDQLLAVMDEAKNKE